MKTTDQYAEHDNKRQLFLCLAWRQARWNELPYLWANGIRVWHRATLGSGDKLGTSAEAPRCDPVD
jgi:hypothetical protein